MTAEETSEPVLPPTMDITPAKVSKSCAALAGASAAAVATALPKLAPALAAAAKPMAVRASAPVAAASALPHAAVPRPVALDATPGASVDVPATLQETKESAMSTTEEFIHHGQANVEAVIKSSQIWTSGLQDLGRTFVESAQAQFDHQLATWKELAGIKSVKEAFDLQSSRARASLEKAVADSGRITDASLKLAEQAMAPLAARFSATTEKFARIN